MIWKYARLLAILAPGLLCTGRAAAHGSHASYVPPAEELAKAARLATPLARGKAYYHIGAMVRAQRELDAALKADPKSVEALQVRGMVHSHERRFPESFRDFEAALALRPKPPRLYEVHYFYGDAAFNAGIYDKAASRFRTLLKLKPDHVQALAYLGETLRKQGRRQEAVQAFRKALAVDPKSAWALHSLADTLRDLGHKREAMENYRKDLKLVPHCQTARLSLAALLDETGKQDEALQQYYTSLAYHLGDPKAHNGMGRIFLRRKEYARSYAEFRRTLDTEPNNAEALQGLQRARAGLDEAAGHAAVSRELFFWRYVGSWLPALLVLVGFLLYRRRRRTGA